jgi:hypothetical protein
LWSMKRAGGVEAQAEACYSCPNVAIHSSGI